VSSGKPGTQARVHERASMSSTGAMFMRSANSATPGPSVRVTHLHLVDTSRFCLQFYCERDATVLKKGRVVPAVSHCRLAVSWPTLKGCKALILINHYRAHHPNGARLRSEE